VCQPYGACVQREAPACAAAVEEEVHGACIELEADGLEEADVVAQYLFVTEVKVQINDVVDVVVAEQEEDTCLTAHILDDDAQGLQHLQEGQTVGYCADWGNSSRQRMAWQCVLSAITTCSCSGQQGPGS